MKKPVTRILFVCTGNICRSPLAEAILAHELNRRGVGDDFEVDSAGTDAYHVGDPPDPRMRSIAKGHGITLRGRSRRFKPHEFDTWDYVFAMDTGHYRVLERYARRPSDNGRIVMFRTYDPLTDHDSPDVPDPWYGSMDGFDRVYEIVSRTCVRIADAITGHPAAEAEGG